MNPTLVTMMSGVLFLGVLGFAGWAAHRRRMRGGEAQATSARRLYKLLLMGACLVGAVAAYVLWEEHQSHILGALFWLLLLLCPLMHIFMHGGHGHHHSSRGEGDGHRGS